VFIHSINNLPVSKNNALSAFQYFCDGGCGRSRTTQPDQILLFKLDMDKKVSSFKALSRLVKSEKWAEFCERVSKDKSLKLFWRLHNSMNGVRQRRCIPDFQTADFAWQRSDEDKGKALLAHYLEQIGRKDTVVRNVNFAASQGIFGTRDIEEEYLVTVDEIKDALRHAKNSAPGPDGIRYEDIGKLSEEELTDLARAFNNSITNATIHEDWMHSYLVPLPKPGKDHTKIQGYRVITMQNTIGKLLEKIIARKISHQLELLRILPTSLGGYRPNRETWSNAAVFAQDVYEGFQSGVEMCAAAVDLEDAYNRVPLDFLVSQLCELKVSQSLINWIAVALFQRKVVFKCGSWASEPTIIRPGLPQGSPLSPVLFNIYTVRITREQIVGSGKTLSYADDVLVYRQGKDRERIAHDLQTELDRIGSWCVEAGAMVNPTKVAVTWFSLNNRIVNTLTPTVSMVAMDVERTNTMRYLGGHFDRCLCFGEQVEHVVVKARKGLTAMRVMAAANCEQRHLILI